MPHVNYKRICSSSGKRLSRNVFYRKAKRLCGEINRGLTALEAKILKMRD